MRVVGVVCLLLFLKIDSPAQPQVSSLNSIDRRAVEIRDLNTAYKFGQYPNKAAWLARAAFLRQQILVSAGLWPLPEKTPLNPHVYDKIEHQDYTIEKVYFESYPGFFVTGNLYRPVGKTGPFPAVLSPHGHWAYGRLENSDVVSVPGRCINLARQGYVVFSSDMIGYNDSRQINHRLAGKALSLWSIGSLGLHLWNNIRSLDFLQSLPDVDQNRLACTGASGGGTQTFLLSAVDDRIKVAAPVNMISHYMQGGDVCENAPNLRIDTNNMELGALMAPRPLLMVSAAGDWTRDTPRVEYPAIRNIYKLLGADENLRAKQVFAIHNYNLESRETVYEWFGRWLLHETDLTKLKERSFTVEAPSSVLSFYGRPLPEHAKTEQQIINYLIESYQRQITQMWPRDAPTLDQFKKIMGVALQHSLAVRYPDPSLITESVHSSADANNGQEFYLSRQGEDDRVPMMVMLPRQRKKQMTATLIVAPEGKSDRKIREMANALLNGGQMVFSLDAFNTGPAKATRDTSDPLFTAYNRTDDDNRVQDILTALAYLKNKPEINAINLVGLGQAGLWCLLARSQSPAINRTAVDYNQFSTLSDKAYLEELYIPGIRRAGDLRTAIAIAPTTMLLIHNTGSHLDAEPLRQVYRINNVEHQLRINEKPIQQREIVSWLLGKG